MCRILAHPAPLTTRIGESPMPVRSPVQPPAMSTERRRLQQSDRSQQIDLFVGVTPTQMPAWRDLPEGTRGTPTRLRGPAVPGRGQSNPPPVPAGAGAGQEKDPAQPIWRQRRHFI